MNTQFCTDTASINMVEIKIPMLMKLYVNRIKRVFQVHIAIENI